MQAVCLAAGRGSRFGDLGRYLQKAVYPVGLKPFMAYTLDAWIDGGVLRPGEDELFIVVGHHAEQVRHAFGLEWRGVKVRYVEQPKPLGTADALARVAPFLHGPHALVWLGDTYASAAHAQALLNHPSHAVLTLATPDGPEPSRVHVTVADGRITKAHDGDGPHVEAGVWKLPPEVMRAMANAADDATTEQRMLPALQRQIDAGLTVGVVPTREWIHLGGNHPSTHANLMAVTAAMQAKHPDGFAGA
jgi:NDP-sugar pyrophosphorylase family protein